MTCPKCGGPCRFRGNFPPNDTEHWQCTECGHKFRVLDQNYRDPHLDKPTNPAQGSPKPLHPSPACESSAPPGADRR